MAENIDAIPRFEREAGITLPDSYREYARACSKGMRRPIRRYSEHIEFLVQNWYQPNLDDELELTGFSRVFDGRTRSWSNMLDGTIVILNAGCEYYEVLVVNGPEYGSVYGDYCRTARIAGSFDEYARMTEAQVQNILSAAQAYDPLTH